MALEQDRNRRDEDCESAGRAIPTFLELWQKLESAAPDGGREKDTNELFLALQADILPRLVVIHAASPPEADLDEALLLSVLTQADRDLFMQTLLHGDTQGVEDAADALIARGVPVEAVFVDLMASSARKLGEMWEADIVDFSEVTVGLCRLHEVLRHKSIASESKLERDLAARKSILLANAAANQHVFGLVMVAEFFRRAGWAVWCEPSVDPAGLSKLVATTHFDVIGLSAATDSAKQDVAAAIRHFRSKSRNPEVKFLVGGQLFVRSPELVHEVGADATAGDAHAAPHIARNLLAINQPGC